MTPKKSSKGQRSRGAAGSAASSSDVTLAGGAAVNRRARRARSPKRSIPLEHHLEAQLRDVVAQIGLDSARRIFASLEAAFNG